MIRSIMVMSRIRGIRIRIRIPRITKYHKIDQNTNAFLIRVIRNKIIKQPPWRPNHCPRKTRERIYERDRKYQKLLSTQKDKIQSRV